MAGYDSRQEIAAPSATMPWEWCQTSLKSFPWRHLSPWTLTLPSQRDARYPCRSLPSRCGGSPARHKWPAYRVPLHQTVDPCPSTWTIPTVRLQPRACPLSLVGLDPGITEMIEQYGRAGEHLASHRTSFAFILTAISDGRCGRYSRPSGLAVSS